MYYYVTKTGLPMFDACRAYGLALILQRLGEAIDATEDVVIQDSGSFYLLTGPHKEAAHALSRDGGLDALVSLSDGWCRILLTVSRQLQVERLGKTRGAVEKKMDVVRRALAAPAQLIETFSQPKPCSLLTKTRKGYESLPGSLDVRAFKGFREDKLDVYNEGGELAAPQEQWALALFGGANVVYWSNAGAEQVAVLPIPQLVIFGNHREIKQLTETGYVSRVSINTLAAHYAVKLAEALRKRRASHIVTINRYSSLVVQSLAFSKSGSWKAKAGSLFPLDYPMQLVESNLVTSAELFTLWDSLFNIGNKKGKELIAITLAELIAQPSMENMETALRVHLRALLQDTDLNNRLYQFDSLKEAMHYVR